MEITAVAATAAALISAISLWKSIRDKRFDEIKSEMKDGFKEIRQDVKEIKVEISDIKERLAGIEMSTIFLQINPTPPSRSEVAKKMWERRKSKQIGSKEE